MDFDLLTHELKKAFAQLDVTEKQEAAKAEKLQRKPNVLLGAKLRGESR